ncbi:MAG: alpha/beta hydrolase [Microcoleus sp. SIO2G3]|nr:alpha/beta hydrolase [Microcoleus sp. SIO2G3]
MNCPPMSPTIPGVVRLRPHARVVSELSIWLHIAVGCLSIGFIPTLAPRPSLGAERLTISYGLVARSIPINSLETYARTGKIDDDLAAYVQYAGKEQLNLLRQFLLTPIPLNAVAVSQFLYTPIGKRLLENLGEVVQQGSGINFLGDRFGRQGGGGSSRSTAEEKMTTIGHGCILMVGARNPWISLGWRWASLSRLVGLDIVVCTTRLLHTRGTILSVEY